MKKTYLTIFITPLLTVSIIVTLIACSANLSLTETNSSGQVTSELDIDINIPTSEDGGGDGGGDDGGGDSGGGGSKDNNLPCFGLPEDCNGNDDGFTQPTSFSSSPKTASNLFLNSLDSEALYVKSDYSVNSYYETPQGALTLELIHNGNVTSTIDTTYQVINGNELRPVDYALLEAWYDNHKNESVDQVVNIKFKDIDVAIESNIGALVTETHTLYNGNDIADTVARSFVYSGVQNGGGGNQIEQ